MNVSECVRAAQHGVAELQAGPSAAFCGAETLSGGSVDFCSNCESVVGAESRAMESGNPALSHLFRLIRAARPEERLRGRLGGIRPASEGQAEPAAALCEGHTLHRILQLHCFADKLRRRGVHGAERRAPREGLAACIRGEEADLQVPEHVGEGGGRGALGTTPSTGCSCAT